MWGLQIIVHVECAALAGRVGYGDFDHLILLCGLIRRQTIPAARLLTRLLPSSLLIVLFRLLIPIDGLRFGLGNPHPLSCNMPSFSSLGWRHVKNVRLFLTTTEVPPSLDWCRKQEIQAVAATIQLLFRR